MNGATLEQARAAKAKLAALFAGRPELRGIGIALLDAGYGVKLNLACRPDDLSLPDTIDGVPVVIDIVGPVRAL
jgi:hypothetical protein